MNNNILKNIEKEINKFKEKYIKFEKINEEEAMLYLIENNTFYNLSLYENNFEKFFINNKFIDKYVDLDFAYLKDLSIIDYLFRNIISKIVESIEHYLGMNITNIIKSNNYNDIKIINEYLEEDYNKEKRIHKNILNKIGKIEYKEILSIYDIDNDKKLENMPLTEFLRVITFGELIDFYDFFTKKFELTKEHRTIYILRDCVRMRNATHHNTPILTNLSIKDNKYPPSTIITNYLEKIGINEKNRKRKLANSRIRQLTSVLYMFDELVTSDGIRKNITNELNNFINGRIKNHQAYYTNNKLLISTYEYFKSIIKYLKYSNND